MSKKITIGDAFQAINDCIDKRWKIRAKHGFGRCAPDCHLCLLFDDDCEGCPVYLYSQTKGKNYYGCSDTPFGDWVRSYDDGTAKKAAAKEVEFLQTVRDFFFNADGSLKKEAVRKVKACQ